MRKTWIKLLSVLVALCLLSTSVLAVDAETDNSVMPRYTYVAGITMGFDIAGDGRSYCYVGVTLHNSNYTCTAEMTLQSNDGSGWDDVKTWSGSGGQDLDLEKFWYVPSGYEYRTSNVVRVYNSNGRLVETVTVASHTVDYSYN